MLVHDLSSDTELLFSDIPALHAVCWAWAEQNNRLSQFYSLTQSGPVSADDMKRAGFPVTIGQLSIACGDFAAA